MNAYPRNPNLETEFEKPRGVRDIEVRHGYTQVHVSGLTENATVGRLEILRTVSDHEISIDFLKLTPDGLSFLVKGDRTDAVESILQESGAWFELRKLRSIVLVQAANMRDEEGLIADIVHTAISSGARVDHIGDMHDRLLMVVPTDQVERVVSYFRTRWETQG